MTFSANLGSPKKGLAALPSLLLILPRFMAQCACVRMWRGRGGGGVRARRKAG